jgi:hypothetical protein
MRIPIATFSVQLHGGDETATKFRVMTLDKQRQRIVRERPAQSTDQQLAKDHQQRHADPGQQQLAGGTGHFRPPQPHRQKIDRQPEPKGTQHQGQKGQQRIGDDVPTDPPAERRQQISELWVKKRHVRRD